MRVPVNLSNAFKTEFEPKLVDFLLELANVTEKKVSREELFKEDEDGAKTGA